MSSKRFPKLLNLVLLLCIGQVFVKALEDAETEIEKTLSAIDSKQEEQFSVFGAKLEALESRLNEVRFYNQIFPRNCYDILKQGNIESGIYAIQQNGCSEAFTVLCNMDVMGGGWTYLLNRFDGSQDFYLNYTDYKRGFGNLKGEFWLGLEHLYELTGSEDNELLVEIVDEFDEESYAFYESFGIGSESEGYAIKAVDGYSGNAGDYLTIHLNGKFTTQDHDEDEYGGNCAVLYHGAWWYKKCYLSQLTGAYTTTYTLSGMNWHAYSNITLKEARMMIRPRNR